MQESTELEDSYPLIGFEQYYTITKSGLVYRKERLVQRGNNSYLAVAKELKSTINNVGYKVINFKISGVPYYRLIHRLVAEMFVPNPNNYDVVNHINSDKLNNNHWNLEWVNKRENYSHWAASQNHKSKFTGVVFDKKLKKWTAHVRMGKLKRLGMFATEELAAKAYLNELEKNGLSNKYSVPV